MACRGSYNALLAPTRRDLLLRIQRNDLLLGYKKQKWGEGYQTRCKLCKNTTTESAKNLFWQWSYASAIWDKFKWPWHAKDGPLKWQHVLQCEHLSTLIPHKYAKQYWTVVRTAFYALYAWSATYAYSIPSEQDKIPPNGQIRQEWILRHILERVHAPEATQTQHRLSNHYQIYAQDI